MTADVSDRAEEATGETNSAEEKSTTKQPSSMNSNALILVGVGVLAVISENDEKESKGEYECLNSYSSEEIQSLFTGF